MDIIYSKCYNGVIMVGGFADDAAASELELSTANFKPESQAP